MAEENVQNRSDGPEEGSGDRPEQAGKESTPSRKGRRLFTRRNGVIALVLTAGLLVLLSLLVTVSYRYGVHDSYIKEQFRAALADMGIVFAAEEFRVTVNPLQLTLENATFNNKKTGQRIFRIGTARIGMTVTDLYQLQFERNIDVNSTDLYDVEAWVLFDENGNSNFDGVELTTPQRNIKFNYASTNFAIRDGLIHFGEKTRRISGAAKNVRFFLEPLEMTSPEDVRRYEFDLTSTDSTFRYGDSRVDPIDIRAAGTADKERVSVSELRLTSPLGVTLLSGTIEDYESPRYDLKVSSTIDLDRTSTVFPLGTKILGTGRFVGKVTGEGEDYKVTGEVTSESLAASNVRLRGLKVNAALDGEGSMYRANGKAIAELLTFGDFRIEFPQLIGNIRGTGTDFRWFGELQAAAAKSPLGTIGGLYINDAYAEYKDKRLTARLGGLRARRFSNQDVDLGPISTGNIRIVSADGVTEAVVPNARTDRLDVVGATLERVDVTDARVRNRDGATSVTAGTVRAGNVETRDARLGDVTARDVVVDNQRGATDVRADSVRADSVRTRDARLKDVTAGDVRVRNRNRVTDVDARTLRAGSIETDAARIGETNASDVSVRVEGGTTRVTSDRLRIATVRTDDAVLGNLNIAGVRLTVRNGRVEGRTDDFEAGTVVLNKTRNLPDGGRLDNVAVRRPVFVLEPSGRYRASLDMSLGGGVLGSISLGRAQARVVAENDSVTLDELTAEVMEGRLGGSAAIALSERRRSDIRLDFTDLDLSKLLALQGGRIVPLDGRTDGRVDLNFPGTDFRRASGSVDARIEARAGTGESGFIPLTGRVAATADNGLFNVDLARLETDKSSLNAAGRFDLAGDGSDLTVALDSTDASEIERILRVLELSPELEQQLDTYDAEFAGNFNFNGHLRGNISNPTIDGRAALDSLILRGRELGSLTSQVSVTPTAVTLSEGVLKERDGGTLAFDVNVPTVGTNNIAVKARLDNIDVGNLLAALPVSSLPDFLRDLKAQASGEVDLTGLPNEMRGAADITARDGTLRGQTFDELEARALFDGSLVNLEKFEARFGAGLLTAEGFYRTDTTGFSLDITATDIPARRIRAFFPESRSAPEIEGTLDLTAKARGTASDTTTYDINFEGTGERVLVNDYALGEVSFSGRTVDRVLRANLTTRFQGQPQETTATVVFSDPDLPFAARTTFRQAPLAPYIALFRKPDPDSVSIGGTATGTVELKGDLRTLNAAGERVFTTAGLSGTGEFSQFELLIDETPLIATAPVKLSFNPDQVRLTEPATFSGGGSNLVVSGTKALSDNAVNNLALNGKINLRLLNGLSENVFFSGLADVAVRLTGSNETARLNGTGQLRNGSASTFVGSERITFDRLRGNILFTSNQIQIEQITGFLGGGRVTATGGILLDGLELERFRIEVTGNNITAPLPQDFLTTGNADIEINGRRTGGEFRTLISGTLVMRRSVYRKDIDLADLISGRGDPTLTTGSSDSSIFGATNLDIRIIGRNALVVRNNIADLTASADLRVSGDADFPQVSGRITADSGTLFFRDNRYEIQRGVLTFPPNTNIEPVINLQAETEIKGYQIFLNLNGSLTDAESLNAVVRSNPSLPQADVISLVTTGSLSDSESGLFAQGGFNTAAEVLTDEIINKPIARATDKLFGLNRFELDPIVAGQRGNPTARLTVGRQINRNLLVTYSTNLSEDQNQVLALEYRVSNRLSFVAQYEQRSLTNVTQDRNNFKFEIRLRKRF